MVAYRIPKQLYFNWFIDCYDFLQLKPKFSKIPNLGLNIFYPRSHCVSCKHQISCWDNIPVISYLILLGKCRYCHHKIGNSYLLTELLSIVAALVVAIKFGINIKLILALLFTWMLILQSLIDFKEYIIPDELTLPMLWLGLMVNHFSLFCNLSQAVFGAAAGYMVFFIIFWIFKLVTGKEGMGYGDFKLLAMLGAWLGYDKLLWIVLIASGLGSLVGLFLIFYTKRSKNQPLPFGPYLSIAGWVTLLFSNQMENWYWGFLG